MNKKAKLATLIAIVAVVAIVALFALAARAPRQCRDGVDNDGDSLIDHPADPGCKNPNDNSELGTAQCDDGIDNDGDTKTDFGNTNGKDSKCTSATDNQEAPKDSCTDSDGGQNFNVQGTVSGDNEDIPYTFTDVCIDAFTVREYYCGSKSQDYAPLNKNQSCTGNFSGCSNGACV